jgi:chromosome segregation ATPase
MAVPEIKRAFRGVDTALVDHAIATLESRIAALKASINERGRAIERLKADIADPATAAPSFSDLGSAFEETLRRAEEQARTLRNSARDEIAENTNKTELELHNLREKTLRETREIIAIATTTANEVRLQAEREITQERQHIADERARLEAVAARAERTASSMISQAEQQISDMRAAAYREIAELERQAVEVVRIASENKIATEASFTLEIADAQANSTAKHDEADSYARDAHEAADAHVAAEIARAAELKLDADAMLANAQIRANEILQDSRALVQKSLAEAIERSAEISRSSEEFFADFVYDAEISINEIRRNKLALGDYGTQVRSVTSEINVDAIEAPNSKARRSIQNATIVEGDR